MINPYDITNYGRSIAELQEFLLFAIIVAGKTAYIQANKLEFFLTKAKSDYFIEKNEPFEILKSLNDRNILDKHITDCKLGQYKKISKAFKYLLNADIDLKSCTPSELELVPGIGPKTSRFFILHSREENVAVLDVHILKWLKSIGYNNAPKTTPSTSQKYKFWEDVFLKYCIENNFKPADLDLQIWKIYAKKDKNYEIQN